MAIGLALIRVLDSDGCDYDTIWSQNLTLIIITTLKTVLIWKMGLFILSSG